MSQDQQAVTDEITDPFAQAHLIIAQLEASIKDLTPIRNALSKQIRQNREAKRRLLKQLEVTLAASGPHRENHEKALAMLNALNMQNIETKPKKRRKKRVKQKRNQKKVAQEKQVVQPLESSDLADEFADITAIA